MESRLSTGTRQTPPMNGVLGGFARPADLKMVMGMLQS